MRQYAALMEVGWIKKCFVARNPCGIIREVERIQDFRCLLQMGRMEEDDKGQKELDKLEEFLNKYYAGSLTMNDINQLDVQLSIGRIKCHGIAKNKEEIANLQTQ